MYLAKYDTNGNILWATNAGGTTTTGYVEGTAVSTDSYGNIYSSGSYYNQMFFDTILTYYSNSPNIYIAKYNAFGDLLWVESIAGAGSDEVKGSAFDNNNNLFISGFFYSPNLTFGNNVINSIGVSSGIFVAKLNNNYPPPISKQYIDIPIGWKIISTYIEPFEPSVDSVFAEIENSIVILKDDIGSIFYPQWNINAIGDIELTEGYIIKSDSNKILEVTGTACTPESSPITLNSGWSMISYLRQSPAPIDSMLINVSANTTIVKNTFGQIFWPLYNINTINQMNPGEGYQIKMQVADTLLYPAN